MTVHNSVKCPAFSNRKGEIDYFGLPCAMHNLHRDFLVGLFFVVVILYLHMDTETWLCVCVCVCMWLCA